MKGFGVTSLILASCFGLSFAAFVLYHFMVFRVNRHLSRRERILHVWTFGYRDRLATEYKSRYPRSIVYRLTLLCAVSLVVLATIFVAIRVWEAATHR